MINEDIKFLKKKIVYRCSYTGTKETDLLYQKLILNKIDIFSLYELDQLLNLFQETSDADILLILTNKLKPHSKYRNMFTKILK